MSKESSDSSSKLFDFYIKVAALNDFLNDMQAPIDYLAVGTDSEDRTIKKIRARYAECGGDFQALHAEFSGMLGPESSGEPLPTELHSKAEAIYHAARGIQGDLSTFAAGFQAADAWTRCSQSRSRHLH